MSELQTSNQPQQIPSSELLQQPEHQPGYTVFEGSGLIDKIVERLPSTDSISPAPASTETADPLIKHWRESYSSFSAEQLKLLAMKKLERKQEQQRHIRLMGLSSMIGGPLIRDQIPDERRQRRHDH